MSKTLHMHQRMSQRGISQAMLDLAKRFGCESGDKTILNRKSIDAALKEFKKIQADLQKMRERGGLVIIEAGELEITAYGLEKYRRH
jgi:hypothetical protein